MIDKIVKFNVIQFRRCHYHPKTKHFGSLFSIPTSNMPNKNEDNLFERVNYI
jgi:hypothetical protein